MTTIGGEVTWQRDPQTGEWKIRPVESTWKANLLQEYISLIHFPMIPSFENSRVHA